MTTNAEEKLHTSPHNTAYRSVWPTKHEETGDINGEQSCEGFTSQLGVGWCYWSDTAEGVIVWMGLRR